MKHGKNYNEVLKKVDRTKEYNCPNACAIVKDLHYVKFNETIEVHIKLKLKKSQSVRDTVVLPHQFKTEKRILVFCKADKVKEALDSGALYAGDNEYIEKIKNGWLDFDIAIATPDMMKDVGRLGMVLGRKGLMPNPKTGTVTHDLKSAIAELRKGRVEFRTDKSGIIHLAIGKTEMESDKVAENLQILIDEVTKRRPADAKGDFIQSIYIAGSMTPSVKIITAKAER